MLDSMRVALVHDWLTGMRGGERVLHQLALCYPEADLYTLLHVPGATSRAIDELSIHTSPLHRLPGAVRHYRKLLPLFPWAIERFRLDDYDLVISTSHAVAKSVPTGPGTVHLDYCLTPMRYVWDQTNAYLGSGLRRACAQPLVRYLRRFDVSRSDPRHVTRFVAISECVAERIRRHYGRSASVVHPPVETERIRPDGGEPDDFYLLVGGFVAYKREDIALEAFGRLGRRLVVAGDGPTRRRLQAAARGPIEFLGRIPDDDLAALYTRCRALIYPQEEDFGIVAVEAQAAGRPVIAFAAGGALETVRPLLRVTHDGCLDERGAEDATGVFFERQSVEDLCAAVLAFEEHADRFDSGRIRAHAEQFACKRFRSELKREVELALARSR